jgi:hypothetical protein
MCRSQNCSGYGDEGREPNAPTGNRTPAAQYVARHLNVTAVYYNSFPLTEHHAMKTYWGVEVALSLGVKRPGREADHSPPSSAEVKE